MSLEYPDRRATHWGLTTIYNAVVQVGWFDEDTAEVWTETETPMDADDILVRRCGNRYFPSSVKLAVPDSELNMTPEFARTLAAALLRAADVADATDVADVDRCGHWAPCDCREGRPSTP